MLSWFLFYDTRKLKDSSRRVNRSSLIINQGSFISRSSAQCATDMSITSPVAESLETELRYVVSAVVCAIMHKLPTPVGPSTPSRTSSSRSIPPLRRACRGNMQFLSVSSAVACFGQVASCINHTSGEHKMFVARPFMFAARPTSRKRNNSCTQQRKLSSHRSESSNLIC